MLKLRVDMILKPGKPPDFSLFGPGFLAKKAKRTGKPEKTWIFDQKIVGTLTNGLHLYFYAVTYHCICHRNEVTISQDYNHIICTWFYSTGLCQSSNKILKVLIDVLNSLHDNLVSNIPSAIPSPTNTKCMTN